MTRSEQMVQHQQAVPTMKLWENIKDREELVLIPVRITKVLWQLSSKSLPEIPALGKTG